MRRMEGGAVAAAALVTCLSRSDATVLSNRLRPPGRDDLEVEVGPIAEGLGGIGRLDFGIVWPRRPALRGAWRFSSVAGGRRGCSAAPPCPI